MKKLMSLVLAAAMGAVLFAGCGASGQDDWQYVQDKGTLKIGITLYQPMNYKDESGNLTGFDTELAEAVCEKLGLTPEFVEIDWDQKVVELKSRSIDCIWNGMTITDELKEQITFSNPYSGNAQVCVINTANADTYQTLEDMAGAKVGAEAGSAGEAAVEADENLSQGGLVAMTAQRDTLLELKSGTIDVAVIDQVMAEASVGEGTSYDDLMIVDGIALSEEEYGIGLRKDSQLADKVNEALQQLANEGVVAELAEKYPSVLVKLQAE